MLPERLSFCLAVFSVITLIYLSMEHKWDWETTVIAVLTGVLVSLLIGSFVGRLSGRELAKTVEGKEPESDSSTEGQPTV